MASAARCATASARQAAARIADLRHAAPATFEIFDRIVRGAYTGRRMPAFDWFSEEDVSAIRNYVLSRAEALLRDTK